MENTRIYGTLNQLRQKKSLSLMFSMLILIVFLSISLVSAADWDNAKSYDTITKTITIENALGLPWIGNKLVEATLITPLSFNVEAGADREVAEIKINNYHDTTANEILRQIKFYDINNNLKIMNRIYTYKYKVIIGQKLVNDYTDVCKKGEKWEVTRELDCTTEKTGSHYQDVIEWKTLNMKDNLPLGELTIGIFTNVYSGDKVEWVMNLESKEITEWANFVGYDIIANQTLYADYSSAYCIGFALVNQRFVIGQTFQVLNQNYNLAGVGLRAKAIGGPPTGTLRAYLYAVDTITGKPTGSILANGSIIYANTIYDNYGQINITTSSYILQKNYNYSIVWKAPEANCDNDYAWYTRPDNSNIHYLYGNEITSSNNGTTWTSETRDLNFAVYGEITGAPTSQVSLSLISPINGTTLSGNGANFTTYFNITTNPHNYTWRNYSLSIWKGNTLFNNSKRSFSTPYKNNTQSSFFIDSFTIGNYKWNVIGYYANKTFANKTTYAVNYTFSVGAILKNINYSFSTIETKSERFKANFDVATGSSISLAQLVYSGTNYTISNLTLSGSNLTILKTIDIPVNSHPYSTEEKSFYFRFVFGGGYVQTTSLNYQNVSTFNLVLCNSTYSTLALNFTVKNESVPLTRLNNFLFGGSFYYWYGNGDVKKNYSMQNSSIAKEARFCINPNYVSLRTDADIDYFYSGYSLRSYYLRNALVSNTTNHITLYLLDLDLSKSVIMNAKDEYLTPLPNHFFKIFKYYPGLGSYYLVEVAKTDDFGNAILKVQEEDVDYRITIEDSDGTQIYSSTPMRIICTATPCSLEFITGTTEHIVQKIIDYSGVSYSLTWNNATRYVLFSFSDSSGLTQSMNLKVIKIHGYGETTICDSTITGAAGISSCFIGNDTGEFIAKVYRSASPSSPFASLSISLTELWRTFGTEGLIWGLLFIVVMFFTGLAVSPAVAGVMTVAGIIFIMATGIVYMPFVLFASIIIVVIIFIIKMRS